MQQAVQFQGLSLCPLVRKALPTPSFHIALALVTCVGAIILPLRVYIPRCKLPSAAEGTVLVGWYTMESAFGRLYLKICFFQTLSIPSAQEKPLAFSFLTDHSAKAL